MSVYLAVTETLKFDDNSAHFQSSERYPNSNAARGRFVCEWEYFSPWAPDTAL